MAEPDPFMSYERMVLAESQNRADERKYRHWWCATCPTSAPLEIRKQINLEGQDWFCDKCLSTQKRS